MFTNVAALLQYYEGKLYLTKVTKREHRNNTTCVAYLHPSTR